MHYFYSDRISGDTVTFSTEEARHLSKSLRVRDGDLIHILDGQGGKHCAKVQIIGKVTTAKVQSSSVQPRPQDVLHLVIAPTKNPSRFEWMVEKATELGIDTISPLVTTRSEKFRIKRDRLRKITISAIKQSGNLFLPTINEVTTLSDFLTQMSLHTHKYIAHCQTEGLRHLANYSMRSGEVTVLVGPEGDFTLEEIASAKNAGFVEVSLGNTRLRTETAGLYVTTLHSILKNINP